MTSLLCKYSCRKSKVFYRSSSNILHNLKKINILFFDDYINKADAPEINFDIFR